jgi:hypothetical protein
MMTALIAALEWADGNDKLNPSDSLRRRPASTLTAESFLSQPPRPGVLMGRRKSLSQSQIRRTIKAVSDTGLKVKKVIIGPDGTLSIESDDSQSADRSKKPLASWEE